MDYDQEKHFIKHIISIASQNYTDVFAAMMLSIFPTIYAMRLRPSAATALSVAIYLIASAADTARP
jgi:hypothetical protein